MNQQKKQQESLETTVSYFPKEVIHNLSSDKLSKEEYEALSYSLDYHISSKIIKNSLNTKFQISFQNLLSNIIETPAENLATIKTKNTIA